MNYVQLNKKVYNLYYILFFILYLLFSSCKHNKLAQISKLDSHVQILKNFKLISTNKGNLRIVVESTLASCHTSDIIHLEHPVVLFYIDGKYIASLTSSQMALNTKTYDFQSYGQCTLKLVDKTTLTTKQLIYNASKGLIYSYNNIIISAPNNIVIYGTSIQTDIQMKNITIQGYKLLIV
ncbi:MAG: LPS export ABC transporter periplasmic protein LptC [Endomicrobium sp.]|jgi:LPS export ABC transporter protein LptC|nr:LPS export ABC transporter periplasmic protein LptC [Endomicrobium sp.]